MLAVINSALNTWHVAAATSNAAREATEKQLGVGVGLRSACQRGELGMNGALDCIDRTWRQGISGHLCSALQVTALF